MPELAGRLESLPPRVAEALLLRSLERLHGERVLCTSLGRAQFAQAYAQQHPTATLLCNYLDLHLAQAACLAVRDQPQIHIRCECDFPTETCDLAVLPFSMSGQAELTRELLQTAQERLALGGQLAAATDNPNDTWLHAELRTLFSKVTRVVAAEGVLYFATKTAPLKKRKEFAASFSFRDGERLLHMVSRPSVFSHRQLDLGARALLEVMEIGAGERVFEIGCGAGVLTVAAAARGAVVEAVDTNPRAVACTLRSAALNGLANITAQLNAQAACSAPGTFDVALANPPYYSQHRLAEIFLHGARLALKPSGRLYLVTKHVDWYETQLPQMFRAVNATPARGYWVYTCEN